MLCQDGNTSLSSWAFRWRFVGSNYREAWKRREGTGVRLVCTVNWFCKSDMDESHRYPTLRWIGNPKCKRHRGQTEGESRINTNQWLHGDPRGNMLSVVAWSRNGTTRWSMSTVKGATYSMVEEVAHEERERPCERSMRLHGSGRRVVQIQGN